MTGSRPLPRGRHTLPPEQVASSQRRRLLDAAVTLAARDGYARTTVAAIAAEAGVSRTTFYEQFDRRESCFRAAYDDVAECLVAAVVAAARAVEPQHAVRAGVDAYLAWFASHPDAAATFVVEIHAAGAAALDQRAEVLERFARVIASAAPEAPRPAIGALVVCIDALAHDLVRRGRTRDLPSLSADLEEIARRLLAPSV